MCYTIQNKQIFRNRRNQTIRACSDCGQPCGQNVFRISRGAEVVEKYPICPENTKNKAENDSFSALFFWSEWRDLNPRPLPPQGSALPNCATPRLLFCNMRDYTIDDSLCQVLFEKKHFLFRIFLEFFRHIDKQSFGLPVPLFFKFAVPNSFDSLFRTFVPVFERKYIFLPNKSHTFIFFTAKALKLTAY